MMRFVNLSSQVLVCGTFLAMLVGSVTTAKAQRVLELSTNAPEALVYADTVLVGLATTSVFVLPAQTRQLRVVHAKADTWSVPPLEYVFNPATASDTLKLALNFPYRYRFETTPFGSDVLLETPLERRLLGQTPLVYEQDEPVRGTFILTRDGYTPHRIVPEHDVWNAYSVTLEPVAPDWLVQEEWFPSKPPRRWLNAALGVVSFTAGVIAIHYKTKADNRYDLYAINGDPTLRPPFERFDRKAAVALGVMQVGVGTLAVRLIID